MLFLQRKMSLMALLRHGGPNCQIGKMNPSEDKDFGTTNLKKATANV
jgi:hypothetical protein